MTGCGSREVRHALFSGSTAGQHGLDTLAVHGVRVLRAVTDDDREPARRWRNHAQVRRASLTTHEIGADEHRAWWGAVAADPARMMLIYEWDGCPAGVVNFAGLGAPDRAAVWGFYLDVDGLGARGQLLPAWMELERAAISYAFTELDLQRIGGETLAWNAPVLRLHARFGFEVTRRYEREIDGVTQQVVWTQLHRQNRGVTQ